MGRDVVGPTLEMARGDVVGGRRILVAAEGGLQVGIVGQVLGGIEQVGGPPFVHARVDEVGGAGITVGAVGRDQVIVGGDVLQAVEGGVPALGKAVADEMTAAGALVRA